MIVLSTDQARVVHAVLEFGPPIIERLSDGDRAHLKVAHQRLTDHTDGLIRSIALVWASSDKEPA